MVGGLNEVRSSCAGLPRRCAPRNDRENCPTCHCETGAHTDRGNLVLPACTESLVPAPAGTCPRPTGVIRTLAVGRVGAGTPDRVEKCV